MCLGGRLALGVRGEGDGVDDALRRRGGRRRRRSLGGSRLAQHDGAQRAAAVR